MSRLSCQDWTRACDFEADCKAFPISGPGVVGTGVVVEGPADFRADFNSVLSADLGVFSTDFGSGVVSGVDLPIFRADFSSP